MESWNQVKQCVSGEEENRTCNAMVKTLSWSVKQQLMVDCTGINLCPQSTVNKSNPAFSEFRM